MPRRKRMYLPELPYHIVQRGNNREACFIELNPVVAGVVSKPGEYKWSSYLVNA